MIDNINTWFCFQAWGSPDRIHASGMLVISPALTESQVSMAIDDAALQAKLALQKTKVTYILIYSLHVRDVNKLSS